MSAAARRTAVFSQGGLARRPLAWRATGSGTGVGSGPAIGSGAGAGSGVAGDSGNGRVTISSSISGFADIGISSSLEHGPDGDAAKGFADRVSPAVSTRSRNASQKRLWLAGLERLKVLRRFVEDPRAVDAVVVVLAT